MINTMNQSEIEAASKVTIAIVVFDGIIPFHLSVPYEVFEKVLKADGTPACEMTICAATPGILKTSAGFSMIVEKGLDELSSKDIIIVPSWDDPAHEPEPCIINALQQAHANGSRIIGLCMGAFVVAAAGLLDGRSATTHWRWAQCFRNLHTNVFVDEKVLYIDNGDVVTSAGTAASIDCCLYIVRQMWGSETANAAARHLVVPPHRQGGQAQYIDIPVPAVNQREPLSAIMDWAIANIASPLTVDTMAEKACISRRHFTRRFQQATGTSFSLWLVNQRLIMVKRYLETTDHSIDRIAEQAGFASTTSLRRHFRQQFDISPSNYRFVFRGKTKVSE
ncbi:AraC family transcriptional regulator [Shewanella baltica]|uniref:GlxA family transcriptional regulator n=1 Tax=Shewanella baltica TaxID=62322 RepID=UPI00217D731A|nr:helix-turn-helix domain-containing protein [Shewanella baltica]MCS6127061.1 AraC family transcriptional regulator [Shewanella baltica]MCS6139139.1 AraC family transcriptional regulator [Shewanella baltica]MCS6145279.1 AraC family transcriptional regulator [Shewanella baltica]MCS6169809.1 AraC family transcriptional regulator [Shewanella baltica]MCS6187033.1 AraC family transcriptional regulator [Shewanella baltica]